MVSKRPEIDVEEIDAVVFDLDGVITKTASVRQAAWAELFNSSVELVNTLQRNGVETALISSSRNVTAVLRGAGLLDLFPVRIDGNVAAELGIPGKPHPAVFLEAVSRVGATPGRAAIVEDAQSGVAAGRAGGFRMVIGVDRGDQAEELAAGGATVVVADLAEVTVKPAPPVHRRELPSAAEKYDEIVSRLDGTDIAVFLDYDGVLTPIVSHPDLAVLSDEMRTVLTALADTTTVAIVSGRDVGDVRDKVQVPGIYYAGSHGFDIVGPDGNPVVDERLDRFRVYLDPLDAATEMLQARLEAVPGAQVERKRFAIAVHYRRVADDDYSKVEAAVRAVAPDVPLLRVAAGKKIFELRPDFDWDKGRALDWLLGELALDRYAVTPIYLGDDTTDEDAFRAIRKRGIGIVVGRGGDASHARYALENTAEVASFLARLAAGM